jgi:hypothetical protein
VLRSYLSPLYALLVLVQMECERMVFLPCFFLSEQRWGRPHILRVGIHTIIIARLMPQMMVWVIVGDAVIAPAEHSQYPQEVSLRSLRCNLSALI